ncbi:MAG: 30S ribosomal protein S16 [Cyclobacteriaceae bacterium]
MAVKIRLARRGRKKAPVYDVVVADARAPRDGRYIEKIGTYNPNVNPAAINIDDDKAFQWVMTGAQPTDTVRAMLSYRGVMLKKHLQIGVIKGAITQEQADAKFDEWTQKKDSKVQGKIDALSQAKDADQKARLEAEAKVKEARAAKIAEKNKVEEAPAEEEATEEAVEEAPAAESADSTEEKKD